MLLSQIVEDRLSRFFFKAGYEVAGRPFHWITGCTLLTVVLGMGTLLLEMENDWYALYTPYFGNQARQDLHVNERYFPLNDLNEQSISYIISKEGGNLLTDAEALQRVKALDDELMGQKFWDGLGLADLCKKQPGSSVCEFRGIPTIVSSDGQLAGPLTSPFLVDGLGVPVAPTWAFLGGVSTGDGNEQLVPVNGFESLRMYVLLNSTHATGFDNVKKWEREYLKFMQTKADALEVEGDSAPFRLTYEATVSGNDELNNSIRPDWRLFVGLGNTVMLLAHLVLRSYSDLTLSKGMVVQPALLAVVLAVGCSFGIMGYTGVKFNLVHMSALVLLFGLGLDDAFLIVQALHQSVSLSTPQTTVQERLAKAMSTAGVSILFTSLTDALVFVIGTSSPLPAVRDFCIFAALGVIFIFVYQIIFFGAALAIDIHREYCNVNEIKGSLGFGWAPAPFGPFYDPNRKLADAGVHTVEIPVMPEVTYMNKKLRAYGKFLLQKPVSAAVAGVVVAYWAFIGIGLTRLRSGLTLKDLTTEYSYWSDFQDDRMRYFNEKGLLFTLTVPPGSIDYRKSSERTSYMDLIGNLEALSCLEAEPQGVWLKELDTYTTATGLTLSSLEGDAFISALQTWLEGPGMMFSDDIQVFETLDQVSFGATRSGLRMESLETDSGDRNGVPCLDRARETIKEWHSGRSGQIPVVTNILFQFWESTKIIVSQVGMNLSFAFVGCFIITLFVLPHSTQLFVILVATASILGGVFAAVPLVWNEIVSISSLISFVITVGFAVDNVVHIAHSYMASRHMHRQDKLLDALEHVGMPILAGNSTTIVGLLWLLLYSSKIYLLFMKIVISVLFLGSVHAMLFLPVFLGNFGPEPLVSEKCESDLETANEEKADPELGHKDAIQISSSGGAVSDKSTVGGHSEKTRAAVSSNSFVQGHDEPVQPITVPDGFSDDAHAAV